MQFKEQRKRMASTANYCNQYYTITVLESKSLHL